VASCPLQLRHQLFFTNLTLTGSNSLFALGIRSRHRGELSLAAPSPIIFHQSHFDWMQNSLPPQLHQVWTYSC
jgi:hypothetical protein